MRLEIVPKLTENSKPIAVFSDGKRKFIQITEEPKKADEIKGMNESEIKNILENQSPDINKLISALEERLTQAKYLEDDDRVFRLSDNDIAKSVMFMPEFGKERELIYIFGPSGSGKSYLTKKYVKEYKLLHPRNNVYLVSKIEGDESFDGMEYIQIPLKLDILRSLETKSFQDSLVIFDDSDTISDKTVRGHVDNLKDLIAQEGRHYNTSCIITTHMATNYQKTRILLNECQKFVIFPQASGKKQMRNMFVTYGGITSKKFEAIVQEPSRWCMLNNTYPNYLVFENKVELL